MQANWGHYKKGKEKNNIKNDVDLFKYMTELSTITCH